MDEQHNNLGDFFKKKLANLDAKDEDWLKPDPGVKSQVLANISVTPFSLLVLSKMAIKMAVIILLLGSGGYAYYNHQALSAVKEALSQEKINNANLNQMISNLSAQHQAERAEWTKAVGQVHTLKQQFQDQQDEFSTILQNQQNIVNNLRNENTVMQESILNYIAEITDRAQQLDAYQEELSALQEALPEISSDPLNRLSLVKANGLSVPKPLELDIAQLAYFINPAKQEIVVPKQFEVGYEFSTATLDIPVLYEFENQRVVSDDEHVVQQSARLHGIQAAYSPLRNWWVHTGARMSNISLQSEASLALAYNPEGQSRDNDGNIFHTLNSNVEMPHAAARSSAVVLVPRVIRLEGGDLLEVHSLATYDLNLLQIPIGINYFNHMGRLGWFLQAGIQWNRINLKAFDIQNTYQVEQQGLRALREYVVRTDQFNSQFFSTYAGLGLDYQVIRNWHFRAAFNSNHHLNNQNNSRLSSSTQFGTTLKLGLHYRF